MSSSLKDIDIRKGFAVAISLGSTIGIFILVRVIAVLSLGELFTEIVEFSASSALNILNWVTILLIYVISLIVLVIVLKGEERDKLFSDATVAYVITVVVFGLVSYNWTGYTYQGLFMGLTYAEKAFRFTLWLTVFAFEALDDVFVFWMIFTACFHALLATLLYVNINNILIGRKKSRVWKIKINSKGIMIFFFADFFVNTVVYFVLRYISEIYFGIRVLDILPSIGFLLLITGLSVIMFILTTAFKQKNIYEFLLYYSLSILVETAAAYMAFLSFLPALIFSSVANIASYAFKGVYK